METEKTTFLRRLRVLVLLVFLVWVAFLTWATGQDVDWSGPLGDTFGSLNALFSGLALAGVIFTLWLQVRQLELQRDELRETRRELEGQKEQLRRQNETLMKTMLQQVLTPIRTEYRSAEMLQAVTTLGALRREHGDGFARAYVERWRSEQRTISELPSEARMGAITASLHYQRRIVSQYYSQLAALYHYGLLPADLLYTMWTPSDLRIIPEILIPLEQAIATELGESIEGQEPLARMARLYEDSVSRVS